MYFWLDTSRCSLYTHLTPYTNVRELYAFPERLLNDRLFLLCRRIQGMGKCNSPRWMEM